MKLHSEVDVITNSSSTVYMCTHEYSKTETENLLGMIMECLGVDGGIDEYFSVEYELDGAYILRAYEEKTNKIFNRLLAEYCISIGTTMSNFDSWTWEQRDPHFYKLRMFIEDKLNSDENLDLGRDSQGYSYSRYVDVLIRPKQNGEAFSLLKQVNNIFNTMIYENY